MQIKKLEAIESHQKWQQHILSSTSKMSWLEKIISDEATRRMGQSRLELFGTCTVGLTAVRDNKDTKATYGCMASGKNY